MRQFSLKRPLKALTILLALSACQAGSSAPPIPSAALHEVEKVQVLPVEQNRSLPKYYSSIQQRLLSRGLLRTAYKPQDAPLSAAALARNFARIALFQEYTTTRHRLVAREHSSHLTRWEKPVRVSVQFGPSVSEAKRNTDRALLAKYIPRLARVTGHSITLVKERPLPEMSGTSENFQVFVLSEDERKNFAPTLRSIVPGISSLNVNAITNMPKETYCLVFARDAKNNGQFDQAIAIIRSEHTDLMRASCFHEEIAQGLGLSNDSPLARPSIFNDDEEFGFLTFHDELLLRILYDTRLRSGMNAQDAKPIISEIAAELIEPSA